MRNKSRLDNDTTDEDIHITSVPPSFQQFAEEVRARHQKPKQTPVTIAQKLSPAEFNTAMVHFYRGEVQRSNVWRSRLDATTNWAVITAGATLSFVFSSPDNPHFAIPINSILVSIFLFMEARRYRYYEVWANRVRVLETGYFAPMLSHRTIPPDKEWAEHISADLLSPHFTISEWEALGRRLRSNYLWIFILLALSWTLKVYIHPSPILANDPHLQAGAPGIWYLTHLSTANSRVSGVTFPGVPGVVLGHNEFIAWGATNVGPDVQDLYFETFNDKGEYKTPDGWAMPSVRKEEIKVRANPLNPATEIVNLDVQTTRNGVIIGEENGSKFALKWTALDPKNQDLEAFFRLNRAKNWNDFKSSLKTYGGATQNFVYADVKGNIGWYAAGKVPIRKTGDGALPYDGSNDDGAWTGFIPFEELPNLYNPAEGFIVTANQRIAGTDYKYPQMSRDAATPWRARRIYDSLKDNKKVTMDDVRNIQYDSLNLPVSNLAKEIVKLNAASPETLEVLKTWDGRMTADSKGAVLANEIRNCVGNKIADDNKPVPSFLIREKILWWAIEQKSARWLPKQFADYNSLLKTCDTESRTSLSDPKRAGADSSKWTWGSVFKARFPHPLSAAPLIGMQFVTPNVEIDGSGQTPNVGSSVSMRHIASPGNWDATRHVIPLGQSGNPLSPHYKDQFEMWRTGTPAIFPFSKSAVEKAAKEIILMTN